METTGTRQPTIVQAVVVGFFAVLTALFGLYYSASAILAVLRGAMGPVLGQLDAPHFYPAFAIMSTISVFCYGVLLVVGIDLLRSRLRWARLISLVFLFEALYLIATGALWLEPTYGKSIAAATGVANGGLMAQFLILLPFWGPIVLGWGVATNRPLPSDDLPNEQESSDSQ